MYSQLLQRSLSVIMVGIAAFVSNAESHVMHFPLTETHMQISGVLFDNTYHRLRSSAALL